MRRAIGSLDRSLRHLVPLLREAIKSADVAKGGKAGRTLKLSPKRRATLKLQGRYLGYMRQLKPRQKSQVRSVREKKGMQAAVRLAKKLAGK